MRFSFDDDTNIYRGITSIWRVLPQKGLKLVYWIHEETLVENPPIKPKIHLIAKKELGIILHALSEVSIKHYCID